MERVKKVCFENLLERAVENSAPGAVAYIGRVDEVFYWGSVGKKSLIPEEEVNTIDTIYDLASLTKVVATTTAIMLLYQEGRLRLDDSIIEYIPIGRFKNISIRHLLSHSSGLPAHAEWYKEINSIEDFLIKIYKTDLLFPPGSNHLYSDFGFILLGHIVELITGRSFESYCRLNIFEPLKMTSTFFKVPNELIGRCAPTELCGWRKKIIRGEVHDENAYALGGVAGHAGLFSTAEDLGRFCRAMIHKKLLKAEVIEEMATSRVVLSYPWQVLGWKTDPYWDSIEGVIPFRTALGHTGFTGTCLWWDRLSGYYAILLSNSCHPSRTRRDNKKLRKTFFNGISILINPPRFNTHPGIDVLGRDDFKILKGAKIGVFTNSSAISVSGKTALDILTSSDKFTVTCLFAGEHGLKVSEEAGKGEVKEQFNGIPIIDVYSGQKDSSKKKQLLKKLDWIVIDIPDIGVRYYTYLASVCKLLGIAVEYDVKILVLDRPNPLGGELIEGPLPDNNFIGNVCWGRVPVRHGMTVGESCIYMKRTMKDLGSANVDVIKADGWFTDLMCDRLDLAWLPPSPNILDFETALCYIGTCLFEGTNLSEGRGTDFPFKMVGAPWLKAKDVIEILPDYSLAGVKLSACSFIPRPVLGRVSHPKYMGEKCEAIKIEVIDPYRFRPFILGYELLIAISKLNGDALKFNDFFDKLAGGKFIRESIDSGIAYTSIRDKIEEDINEFKLHKVSLYSSLSDERKKMGC
ncbi:MAG: DUF1343 domain-containing protein [Candidatus Hydrogenedentes bacterium]|nr:DUF1343 domain-containing protein [Candidatus Hydrogenedentota bacterium]